VKRACLSKPNLVDINTIKLKKSTEKLGTTFGAGYPVMKTAECFSDRRGNQHELHFTLMEDRAVY
jgi:hypothetical protein